MQRPILCYTGRQANVSIYRQEHYHAAKRSSLRQPLQGGRGGQESAEPKGRACCEMRRALPPSSWRPGEGGGGTGALSAWEEPLPPSCLRLALGAPRSRRQETMPEGGSVWSACSAAFRTAEPVCGQTRCDHPEALRGGQALPHSREQKAGQQLWGWRRPGLWGGNENVGKKGITFRNLGLEIGAENQILRGSSKSRRGSPTGPGRAYQQTGMEVSLDP